MFSVSVDNDFCFVVAKVQITRSTRVITHFNLQQKVPLNKVSFARLLLRLKVTVFM